MVPCNSRPIRRAVPALCVAGVMVAAACASDARSSRDSSIPGAVTEPKMVSAAGAGPALPPKPDSTVDAGTVVKTSEPAADDDALDAGDALAGGADTGPPVASRAAAGADAGPAANSANYDEFPTYDCANDVAAVPRSGPGTYAQVHELLVCEKCGNSLCHGPAAGLHLSGVSRSEFYVSLVGSDALGAPAGSVSDGGECTGTRRVVPGDPDNSLLYLKLANRARCGDGMPPADFARQEYRPFTRARLELVRSWIESGANKNAD
jgi:hypothetical protein